MNSAPNQTTDDPLTYVEYELSDTTIAMIEDPEYDGAWIQSSVTDTVRQ